MTLTELTTPLTAEEVKTAIYEAVEARGTATTTWKPGAVVRTIIAGVAIVIAAFSELVALIAKLGFLELSEGDWLTLVAKHVYGVERDQGTFATGTVSLTNTGGGVFTGDPGDLVVLNPSSGKSYRNTEPFALGALATILVPIQAIELGSASTSGHGTITDFETPLLGVSVTNIGAVVGTDPEEDAALRARCRAKTGALSPNGPRDAYAYVATSAKRASGESIGVERVRTVPDGVGGVDVYVATANGTITGTNDNPATDLGAVAKAIHEQVEPLAITPDVQAATPLTIAVTYELWVRDTSSLSDPEIDDLVEERLAEHLRSIPIGGQVIPGQPGRVYVSGLAAVIGASLPGREVRVSVTLPAADVAVTLSQAPILGLVTGTIHQVAGDLL
jgi:uncharacterized phage protein gp47/JayE